MRRETETILTKIGSATTFYGLDNFPLLEPLHASCYSPRSDPWKAGSIGDDYSAGHYGSSPDIKETSHPSALIA